MEHVQDVGRVSDLTEALRRVSGETVRRRLWFRGHASSEWELSPSLVREINSQEHPSLDKLALVEQYALKRFKQLAPAVLGGRTVSDEGEWLLLMQHYRLPTRLLDWTENPLVALYFAISSSGGADESRDGALWILDPSMQNRLRLRARDDAEALVDFSDGAVKSYLPQAFSSTGKPSPMKAVAVIAKRSDPRIIAQQGVFTFHAALTSLTDDVDRLCGEAGEAMDCGSVLSWVRIPRDAKGALLEELELLGVSKASLFPELEQVAGAVTEEMREVLWRN